MRLVTALLMLALLATGCSRRDRANPFDPGNPSTGGRPAGFLALAGNSVISLRWERPGGAELLGFHLTRRLEGESGFQVLADLLPPSTTTYTDFGVQNGKRHDYRLSFVFAAAPSLDAATDFATPGPLRPWVTTLGSAELLRLTADGRRVYGSDPLYERPTAVAVDVVQGLVWVSDPFLGIVVRLNPANGDRLIIGTPNIPGAIAIDPARHTAWVCDERLSQVSQFRVDGNPGVPIAIGPFDLPLAVAIDPVDASVWVCDNGSRRVLEYASSGLPRWSVEVPRPSRIAIDSLTRLGWVTSFESGCIVRIDNGAVLDTIRGFQGPIGIAIDPRRGRIWVADAVSGRIVTLFRDGEVEHNFSGYPEVRDLAIDLVTGNAWATVPGDGRVVVVSPTGAIVSQIPALDQPYAIALDPGTAFTPGAERVQGSTATLRDVPRPPSRSRSQ